MEMESESSEFDATKMAAQRPRAITEDTAKASCSQRRARSGHARCRRRPRTASY